jgi:hypothetical protein
VPRASDAILPANHFATHGRRVCQRRQPPISTLNLAHMMPLSAVWAGPDRNEHLNGPPLLFAKTEGATPFPGSRGAGRMARYPLGDRLRARCPSIVASLSLRWIKSLRLRIPAHRGQPFRGIADGVPVIADGF